MSTVEIVLKEGPVLIPSLAGSGVNRTFPLWNDISASEFFPPNVQSAFYILLLQKLVGDADVVHDVERELVSALRLLAMAWPFSGGSFMVLDSRELLVSDQFQSNADRVRSELLAATGKREEPGVDGRASFGRMFGGVECPQRQQRCRMS